MSILQAGACTPRFHDTVAQRVRQVPFADTTITVIDCTSLAVFEAFFNRTKDWADLAAMAEAGQLDVDAASESGGASTTCGRATPPSSGATGLSVNM